MTEYLRQKRRLPAVPQGAAFCLSHIEDTARAHVAAMEQGRAMARLMDDSAKARRELGYDPRPLREGLAETLRYEMQLLRVR